MKKLLKREPDCASVVNLMNQFVKLAPWLQRHFINSVLKKIRSLSRDSTVDIDHVSNGKTALHIAVLHKQHSFVRVLVQEGCDVNIKNSADQTALHIATAANNIELVEYFLAHEANIEERNLSHQSALAVAARHGYVKIVKILLRAGAKMYGVGDENSWPLMHRACSFPGVISAFIDAGIDVNRCAASGRTPLHYACNEKCANLLIDAGAIVNFACVQRVTPLMLAIHRHASSGTIKALLVAGADVDLVDVDDHTALSRSLQGRYFSSDPCYEENMLWLIAAGADIDSSTWRYVESVLSQDGNFCKDRNLQSLLVAARETQNDENDWKENPYSRMIVSRRAELQRLIFASIKQRIAQICVALQELHLPALVTLAIIDCACDLKQRVAMFRKWNLITAVKHFQK
jgi:ankyrin repeat protein